MAERQHLKAGETVAIQKPALNPLLERLAASGFEILGPQVRDQTIVYETLSQMEQLPRGYVTEQSAGRFRLHRTGSGRYFDFIPAAQSWKKFLFPSRTEIVKLTKNDGHWQAANAIRQSKPFAFVGVRACELAAIHLQDKAFLRPDYADPVYRSRRDKLFVLAVNCLHPASTCFCASMQCGPRVGAGYDICLTELDDVFLLTAASELGLTLADALPWEPASGLVMGSAELAIQTASETASSIVDPSRCVEAIARNLEHPHWDAVAERCLSCGNCTMVCPTCFCWDVEEHVNLSGNETRRERVWDSCFNPSYSYQAGGNTRPTIKSRYRQWLSHKFSTWTQQYGQPGCVGCGRCITWCPAGIDTRKEVAALQAESDR
jgi:sulfhydrogenase subunit beta (sulfur reductase)